EPLPSGHACRTRNSVLPRPRTSRRSGRANENGAGAIERKQRPRQAVPGVLTDEHGAATPRCVECPERLTALDEPFLVEQSVRRQEVLPVDVPYQRRGAADPHPHRAVVEDVVPDLVKAEYDLERPVGCLRDRVAVHALQIGRLRAGREREFANSALEEISGECGLGQMKNLRPGREAVELGKQLAQAREVRLVFAFARRELDGCDIDDGRHDKKVVRQAQWSNVTEFGEGRVILPPADRVSFGTLSGITLGTSGARCAGLAGALVNDMNVAVAVHARPRSKRVMLAAIVVVLASPPVAARAQSGGTTGDAWQIVQPAQSSLVFARDGTSLIGEIGREIRTSVSIRSLPKYGGEAFISVEGQRFYQHDGVDVVGVAAALKDALRGHARGASTITQQLVGNMHPDVINRSDRSIARKLREQAAAREMERHYSKEQILEAYLNDIDFGHGWYGIEAAARHYFGIEAARLTLEQAATLAALPQGPALYDPIKHPDRSRERRNLVLSLMADQGYITRAEADQAEQQPLVTAPDAGMPAAAPYVVDLVREEAEQAGVPVMNGGYRIVTTIDPDLERDATMALDSGLARVEARPGYHHETFAHRAKGSTDFLEGMVVAIDPQTGDVLAMVGGRDYAASPFNRAVNALRQPGSAFKPIVYASALRDSIPPNALISDTALAIP